MTDSNSSGRGQPRARHPLTRRELNAFRWAGDMDWTVSALIAEIERLAYIEYFKSLRQDPVLLLGMMQARLFLSLMLAVTRPADEAELREKAALLLQPAAALHSDDVLVLFHSALTEDALRLSVADGSFLSLPTPERR